MERDKKYWEHLTFIGYVVGGCGGIIIWLLNSCYWYYDRPIHTYDNPIIVNVIASVFLALGQIILIVGILAAIVVLVLLCKKLIQFLSTSVSYVFHVEMHNFLHSLATKATPDKLPTDECKASCELTPLRVNL